MTYWERIVCSARYFRTKQDNRIQRDRCADPNAINKIEVWYWREGQQSIRELLGGDECYDFLSRHSSFDEVQEYLELSGPVYQICCTDTIDQFNSEYYKVENPSAIYNRGTIEIFRTD